MWCLMATIKLLFIIKHLWVAETLPINHWGIQGCTPEECTGKNPYFEEEEQIFICICGYGIERECYCLCL